VVKCAFASLSLGGVLLSYVLANMLFGGLEPVSVPMLMVIGLKKDEPNCCGCKTPRFDHVAMIFPVPVPGIDVEKICVLLPVPKNPPCPAGSVKVNVVVVLLGSLLLPVAEALIN
jgi:hypothetical protein